MTRLGRRAVAVVGLLFAMGCEDERPPLGRPICVDWKTEVEAVLRADCVNCHGATAPEGGVELHRYDLALSVVRPGDPTSPILTVFDAEAPHRDLRATRPLLERWVVDCEARYLATTIHPTGVMNPSSPDFHGAALRDSAYDFESCQECHGSDYSGGGAQSSCLTCHPKGPTDCSTCHGEAITSGAHAIHLQGGILERPVECATCHVVPSHTLMPGHIRLGPGRLDPPPVEVIMTGPAAWDPPMAEGSAIRSGPPSYDPETQTCSSVYCHDLAREDAAAERPSPAWTEAQPMDCASCHGQPPADHASERCGDCHGAVSSGPDRLTDLEPHLDGRVQLAATGEACDGCHGGAAGSPPPDLDGLTSPLLVTVGAHESHLRPRLRLSNPVACSDCHRVPDRVLAPGHIDSARPAEVFVDVEGTLAGADGALPRWDRATGTCRNVYCHGGGTAAAGDTSSSRVLEIEWLGGAAGQVFCGSCHGIAPTTGGHFERFGLTDCVDCHVRTVDQFGNIRFVDGVTAHMNGVVDFDPGAGGG